MSDIQTTVSSRRFVGLALAALLLTLPVNILAQAGRGEPTPPSARMASAVDFTGYWASQIVDEWRFRVTPIKDDIRFLPLNAEARRIANNWDPAKDTAESKQCGAYGAVGAMQRPGRIHITWANDNTLQIDFDSGTQTRNIHFGGVGVKADEAPSWQGLSTAAWDLSAMPRGGFGARNSTRKPDSFIVKTRNMIPGYIRKNGVPYSNNAVLTEYFNRLTGALGESYLVVTAEVVDPTYLTGPFVRTYTFKSQPDASGWDPTPCYPK